MDASWTDLFAPLLRPHRPLAATGRGRTNAHAQAMAVAEQRAAEQRAHALADCRARIEHARSSVFEAGDGVVSAQMTALEREWMSLARAERSSEARRVALASDPDGVERAESCALRFAAALSAWRSEVPPAVMWRAPLASTMDTRAAALLDRPLRALSDAIAPTYGADALLARADRLQREAVESIADCPFLASNEALRDALVADVALVARFTFLWRACVVESRHVPADHPNAGRRWAELECPATALLAVWATGYVPCAIDRDGVTLAAMTAASIQ